MKVDSLIHISDYISTYVIPSLFTVFLELYFRTKFLDLNVL